MKSDVSFGKSFATKHPTDEKNQTGFRCGKRMEERIKFQLQVASYIHESKFHSGLSSRTATYFFLSSFPFIHLTFYVTAYRSHILHTMQKLFIQIST